MSTELDEEIVTWYTELFPGKQRYLPFLQIFKKSKDGADNKQHFRVGYH